jgi:hypothetical protein
MSLPSPSGLLAYPSKGNYFDDPAHSVNSRYNRGLNGGFKGTNIFDDGIVSSGEANSSYYGLLAAHEVIGGVVTEVSAISTNRGPASATSNAVLGIFPTNEGTVGYKLRSDKNV